MSTKTLTVAAPSSLSIQQVFQAVIEKQISPENIQVMKELLAIVTLCLLCLAAGIIYHHLTH